MNQMLRWVWVVVLALAVGLSACGKRKASSAKYGAPNTKSLAEGRAGYETKLTRQLADPIAPEKPPKDQFLYGHYPAQPGKMAAYISKPPADGKRRPAIIWLVGGFGNGIDSTAWTYADRENNQSASAFREAGIVTMYPALRGGSANPGVQEGFYGEVDDVLAAADFLAKQSYVDPKHIYLGGHSTGGTLAMLVAEMSPKFRAVFASGPVGDVTSYGQAELPFDVKDKREAELRAPIRWLESIESPVFVFEGMMLKGNILSLREMRQSTSNRNIRFHEVPHADHFTVLHPLTKIIAQKILADASEGATNIEFTKDELETLTEKY
jgi:dipeptidyl aminopeptidase/acylaminoacyl peptidase